MQCVPTTPASHATDKLLSKIHSGSEAENKKKHFSSALYFLNKFFIATADTQHTLQARPVKRVTRVKESSGFLTTFKIFLLYCLSLIILPSLVQMPSPILLLSQVHNHPQSDSISKNVSIKVLSQVFMWEDQLKSFLKQRSRLVPDLWWIVWVHLLI